MNTPDGELRDNGPQSPELSLVIPCYNEENCLELTVPPLVDTFNEAGVSLQLVLVDNGSRDRTSEIIDRLIAADLPITKGVVEVNQGQGLGLLTGFKLCRGRYIGYLCADGQVAPKDVLSIYGALRAATTPTIAKARRRFRQDSWLRKVVSINYNIMMLLLFPGLPSLDVNGNPKIMPAALLNLMELGSRDWFLEAEIMLKARHLRTPVIEFDVPGQLRAGGTSHVRMATVAEFLRNIAACRLGYTWHAWSERVDSRGELPEAVPLEV